MTHAPHKFRLSRSAVTRRQGLIGGAAMGLGLIVGVPGIRAQSGTGDSQVTGRVEGIRGYAGLIGIDRTRTAEIGSALRVGDVIQTAEGATLAARLVSGTMLFVGPGSRVDTSALDSVGGGRIGLLGGIIRAIVPEGSPDPVEIEGRYAIASVRGTEFVVSDDATQTSVLTLAGSVGVANPGDAWRVILAPGDGIDVTAEFAGTAGGAEPPVAPPVNRWGPQRIGRAVSMTTVALP